MATKQIHLKYKEREYLRQLILEADVQRFNREESLAYVRAKLHKQISIEAMDQVKRNVKRNLASKLDYYRKNRTAFIEQFFRRIAEIEKYQATLWSEFHRNMEKPYLRKDCLVELHQLTITLANLYEILPAFTGQSLNYEADIPNTLSENTGITT